MDSRDLLFARLKRGRVNRARKGAEPALTVLISSSEKASEEKFCAISPARRSSLAQLAGRTPCAESPNLDGTRLDRKNG